MNKWHGALAAVIALTTAGCGAADAGTQAVTPAAVTSPAATTPSFAPVTPQDTTPALTAGSPDPKPADFKITVKTTKKQCFGTAGCNVTYHIVVNTDYIGDPDVEWLVTYEVKGGEDPAINSFTLTGTRYTYDQEETMSTPRSSSKLTAKVTDVSQN